MVMKWGNIIKEGGAVSFGSHGSNPLFNIRYGKKVDKKNLLQEEEEDEEIAKD